MESPGKCPTALPLIAVSLEIEAEVTFPTTVLVYAVTGAGGARNRMKLAKLTVSLDRSMRKPLSLPELSVKARLTCDAVTPAARQTSTASANG